MAKRVVIDSDAHLTEPPDVWTSRVPAKYVDAVPHVARDDQGRDVWIMDGAQIAAVGATAPAGFPGAPALRPKIFEELHPGAYDAKARLEYLDEAAIWAQVLYPNVAGFGNQKFRMIKDPALQEICIQAYNDFLDEWTSADHRRLIRIASVPFWDVKATVREVERCAEKGFRGVLFTGEPQRFGLPPIGDTHWDPLWSTAQDAGLPIHFHIGGGEDDMMGPIASRVPAHGPAGAEAFAAAYLFMKNGIQCADLITSGLLPRFPELKFVSVESGIGWVPFVLEAADYSYIGAATSGRHVGDLELPSEGFRRQVYVTFWFEQTAPARLLGDIPMDKILFETDFPHVTCLYGNIQETIESGIGDLDEEARRMLLWDNASNLYHVEPPSEQELDALSAA
jgi:predicted TIM-barrel fold metal-dependent hydrolase